MAAPTRPDNITAVSTGPNSLVVDNPTIAEIPVSQVIALTDNNSERPRPCRKSSGNHNNWQRNLLLLNTSDSSLLLYVVTIEIINDLKLNIEKQSLNL